jgi:recombination protein RecA
MFGNPETTTGGKALKFYASVRMDVRRIQAIKSQGEVIGSRTRVRVKKNKVAAPFGEAEFDIMHANGISKVGDLLDLGVEYGIVDRRGSYYRYDEELIGQGRENAKQFLTENRDIALAAENRIRSEAGLPLLDGYAPPDADEAYPDATA